MLQPLFYKEGDDNYENLFPIKYTVAVICAVILLNLAMCGVSAFISNLSGTAGEVTNQLESAKENNREAREITADVTEGLSRTSETLREAGDGLKEDIQQLNVNAVEASKIGAGLQHIYTTATEAESDLARTRALVDESLSILQEVENKSKGI